MSGKVRNSSAQRHHHKKPNPNPNGRKTKRTCRKAGQPDPDAEVVALSAEDLLASGDYACGICGKSFCRKQNLQVHMRTHSANWGLARNKNGGTPASRRRRRKAYMCPVPNCVYNDRSRALSDPTGIRKHFSRKHGDKNLTCPRCFKQYAIKGDLKAHFKKHHLQKDHSNEMNHGFCCMMPQEGNQLPSSAPADHSTTGLANPNLIGNGINAELPAIHDTIMEEQQNGNAPVLVDNQEQGSSGDQQLINPTNSHLYDQFFGVSSSSSGNIYQGDMGPAATPAPTVVNGLRDQNSVVNGVSSPLDFFGGSSPSSFIGLGANISPSKNFCVNGASQEKNYSMNYANNNNFFGFSSSTMNYSDAGAPNPSLSASFFDYYNGTDEANINPATIASMNSMQNGYPPATALLQNNAALIGSNMAIPSTTCFSGQAKTSAPSIEPAASTSFLFDVGMQAVAPPPPTAAPAEMNENGEERADDYEDMIAELLQKEGEELIILCNE